MTTYYVRNADRSKAIDTKEVTGVTVGHYRAKGESHLIVRGSFGKHEFRFSGINHTQDADNAAKDITYHMNNSAAGSDDAAVRLAMLEKDYEELKQEVAFLKRMIMMSS